jgi:hypothetical protein
MSECECECECECVCVCVCVCVSVRYSDSGGEQSCDCSDYSRTLGKGKGHHKDLVRGEHRDSFSPLKRILAKLEPWN